MGYYMAFAPLHEDELDLSLEGMFDLVKESKLCVVHTGLGLMWSFDSWGDAWEFCDADDWSVANGGTNEHGGCEMGMVHICSSLN